MTDRIDLALKQVAGENYFDIAYNSDGELATVLGFDTAIQMSILSQQRATVDEVAVPELRRGWIGSLDADFEPGSKIWLFDQARRIGRTLSDIKAAGEAGVQWFLDEKLVDQIEVTTEFTTDGILLTVLFVIENRPTETALFELWKFSGATT